ncbi:MAG TPA: sulfotransferase [Blastocatellia bacterium]|nr:sulfotransferase [Blastocatellia bacterium]
MTNPYVFIVGCARSGTTLLERMVDAHPEIAITHQWHTIPRVFEKRKGLTEEGLVTPELISHLLKLPWFTCIGISREGLLKLMGNGQSVHYSDFVTGIFELYGKAQGKALVGDKTPNYVRKMRILHALWPRARFVHLIRDGRDVCLSVANWPKAYQADKPGSFVTWIEDPVSTIAFWWELNVRLGREAGSWLGSELYYEIRYEPLVNDPAEQCAALCGFLGLPYDDAMPRYHEDRTKADPEVDAGHPRLPVTAGLRDWRSQMQGEDVERFEAVAGGLLDKLGYPRAFPRPRAEKLENASRIRSLLVQDPRWRCLSEAPHANEAGVSASKGKESCPHGSA